MNNRCNQIRDHHCVGWRQGSQEGKGIEVKHHGRKTGVERGKDLVQCRMVKGRGHGRKDREGYRKMGHVDIWGGPSEGRVQVEKDRQRKEGRADGAIELS